MTRLGDITVPTMLSDERIGYQAPNAVLGQNSTTAFTVATYTMPMTGRLSASLLVQAVWANQIQQFDCRLSGSAPVPAGWFDSSISLNGLAGGRTVIGTGHVMALWPVLAVGTAVTVSLEISVGPFPAGITLNWIYGWLRSHRTDT
jgi:hypothetical protein